MKQLKCWFAPAALAILLCFGNTVQAGIDVAAGKPVTNVTGVWANDFANFAPQNALNGSLAEPDQNNRFWLSDEGTAGESFTVNLGARYLFSEFALANTHNAGY